jgi:hypothetical protein
VLRADGGRTSFHTWETDPGSEEFRNGSYTVAKSRHPYVKIFDKDGIFGTSTGYVHLY